MALRDRGRARLAWCQVSRHCCFSSVSVARISSTPQLAGPSPQPSPTGRGSQFGLLAQPVRATRYWLPLPRGEGASLACSHSLALLDGSLSHGEREPVWPVRTAWRATRYWLPLPPGEGWGEGSVGTRVHEDAALAAEGKPHVFGPEPEQHHVARRRTSRVVFCRVHFPSPRIGASHTPGQVRP